MNITPWHMMRKTPFGIYISYGLTTDNLYAENLCWRMSSQFELSIDLSGNLRTRNKQLDRYQDALELANGKISNLSLVQINDGQIIRLIFDASKKEFSKKWKLTVHLKNASTFTIRPVLKGTKEAPTLFLYVED